MNLHGRMSRGQSQARTRSARTALRRCNNGSNNNTDIVDLDVGKVDVIIVDCPESSKRKSRCSNNTNKKHFQTIIYIEDDDDIEFRRVDHCSTSSKAFHASFSNSYASGKFNSDDCQMLNRKGKGRCRCPKRIFGTISSECSTSTDDTSERGTSESDALETKDFETDSSDCEMMDSSSVNIREEWEKAALNKKINKRYIDPVSAFGSPSESGVSPCETSEGANMNACIAQNENEVHSNANTSVNRTDDQSSAPDILNGFTEEYSFKLKRKDSAGLSDHTGGEARGNNDAKKENKPLSGKSSPHECHSPLEVSFEPKVTGNPSGQDVPLQSSFPPDMQHGLYCQINGLSSMDNEDNERASLFTARLQDEPQYEDMQKYENLSSYNIPCPSKNMPGLQTGRVTMISQDNSSFQQSQNACASPEAINCLNEQHTDILHACCTVGGGEAVSEGSMQNSVQDVYPVMIYKLNADNMNVAPDIDNDIMGGRERLKESEEYKRAEEEEWASRLRQVQIQSEEAQRLRKRKKAETLRLLDMEKRQKQRLEEIREFQKRDEETINLKEQIRVDIQKELEKLEMKYRDMASLLRGLGVNVGGGLYPLPHEVNAAYKQALLRFHPDRASRTDIRQQVEAEEKFKMISRLKEKLLPVAY